MKDTIVEFISDFTEIDKNYINMDMSIDSLNLDLTDIEEILISVESDLDIDDAMSILPEITTETTVSELVDLLEKLV